MLAFFDQLLDGETVALSEMKDQIPEHSEVWRGRWERMTEKLDAADEGQLELGPQPQLGPLAARLRASALLGVVILLAARRGGAPGCRSRSASSTLIGLVARSRRPAFKRLDAESRERTARWQAFARWTEDFPRLEDDPPATLELWKRILVYGVAFGTAERMIESGRIPEPVVAAAGGGWSYYYVSGGWSSRLQRRSFSSGFSSQVAPEASSSGGGGGFSRRRGLLGRRRRRVLVGDRAVLGHATGHARLHSRR